MSAVDESNLIIFLQILFFSSFSFALSSGNSIH